MTLRAGAGALVLRLRHPRTTVRWRLTLLYGGLFLVSGAALLAITYTLVEHADVANRRAHVILDRPGSQFTTVPANSRGPIDLPPPVKQALRSSAGPALRSSAGRAVVSFVGSGQRVADLHQLVIESATALAIMAIISTLLGWLVAGRVLRPLRTMTATAQQISAASLHQRLAMPGPRDELRELAETIDGLLERLEGAFDAQRRFVANASHELRTPLSAARALLELVISDPNATVTTFRTTCRQVLEESEQQEQLIDALLALAQGQRGIAARESFDLAAVVDQLLRIYGPEAAARALDLNTSLEIAPMSGDRRLIERLVSNLLENALRHNVAGGGVNVAVGIRSGWATLSVTNTGPPVPEEEIERLLQPFQRLAADRVGQRDGLGLGLSIVAAIAKAHSAQLEVTADPAGGLAVQARFPECRELGPARPVTAIGAGTRRAGRAPRSA
jgi:signal transduction histidine kinase